MSFHSPHLLWLLVPLILLFSWELARHNARVATQWPKIARAWAGAFQVSLGSAHTTAETRPRLWLWFGLALCIIALARPQWGVVEEKVFDQSREVLIAVDLSRSMLAQDVKPSRLDRSKLLISSLLDGLKGERVGLVLFAGTSFLQSPLSSDYEILREFLPALKPDYLPEGGSNYKAMLEASIQAFGTSTADRYLIILSDGESTEDDWKELGETLKTKGIRVIGLGVGTTQGGFIPDDSGGYVKDERGAVVLSRLNGSTLQELAQTSGGAYADASSWVDLSALLKQTVEAGKKGDFSEKNTARLLERFQWFLAPGLLLLLISFWAEFPVRPRERALPLGATRKFQTPKAKGQTVAAVSSLIVIVFCLSTLSSQLSAATSGSAAENGADSFAAPLTATITRLVAQGGLKPKDCSELAETTLTFGQRLKSAQKPAPEGVVRDALAAVDLGEKTDAKAADWPRLRKELEELLKKEEPPKQDQKKQDQQKQEQKDKDQQQKYDQKKEDQQDKDSQDQKQKDQQGKQDQQKSDQQKQDEQKPESQNQQEPKEDAFGDMKEKQQPPAPKPEPPKQPPSSGTQKVGGQSEKKPDAQLDPELAVPMQKLEQVRNQDSPAKLQQLMQGKPQKPKPKGKDW